MEQGSCGEREAGEGSAGALLDPPILATEMDSSVEKVSSDPWVFRARSVAGMVVAGLNLLVFSLDLLQGSGSLDPDDRTASGEPKACTDCHTTKTPLWRGGPSGPKVRSDLILALGFPICAFISSPVVCGG